MASAASSGSSTPTNRQHNRECPVCFRIFQTPKMLRCGQSICAECADRLKTLAGNIECPVCRHSTNASLGLPTNFSLQNLIEETPREAPKAKIQCNECSRRQLLEDMWSCKPCNMTVVCANCIIKGHRDHDVQEIKQILETRQREFAEWRDGIERTHNQFMNRQLELENFLRDTYRLGCKCHSILRTQLMPSLTNAVRNVSSAGTIMVQGARGADVSNLTASGRYETYLKGLPRSFQNYSARQDRIKRDIGLVHDLVENTADVMQQLVNRFQNGIGQEIANEEGDHQRNQASSGAAAQVRNAESGAQAFNAAQEVSAIDWPIEEELEHDVEHLEIQSVPERQPRMRDLANALPSADSFFPMIEDEISIEDDESEPVHEAFGYPRRERQESQSPIHFQRMAGRNEPSAAAGGPRYVGGIGRGLPVADVMPTIGVSLGGIGRGNGRGRGRGILENEYQPIAALINRGRLLRNVLPANNAAIPSYEDAEDN